MLSLSFAKHCVHRWMSMWLSNGLHQAKKFIFFGGSKLLLPGA